MKIRPLAAALLALSPALPARADSHERLEHLLSLSLAELMRQEVTISTHTKRVLATAPAVVTVITAEDIKATGATNLVDVLEGVPGIHVRTDRFGFRPLVHFRGANATQTRLMVNGAPMKDLSWGFGIFWKGLPASAIERVEIIRGPGSALYGADASAGVINVITKTAGRIAQSEAGVRLGSYDSATAWLQHGARWHDLDIGLTAEVSGTDGHSPRIAVDGTGATGTADNGWRNVDLRFAVAKGDWRLRADYARHSDLETALTGAGVLDPVTRASDSRFNLDLLYDNDRFAPAWGVNAELRYRHIDYSSGTGFQENPDGSTNRQRAAEHRLKFELGGLYSGVADHQIRLGAGHVWQDLYRVEHWANFDMWPGATPPLGGGLDEFTDTPYAFAPEKARTVSYLYGQDIWALAQGWELTAGLRYDHYSDFGGTLNPRLALVWQTTPQLTSKLLYGQSFRAPSYQELYSPTANAAPNPNLDPERSRTLELAWNYAATKDLQFGLGLYRYRQSDVIYAQPGGAYANGGEHEIRGVELEAHWQASPAVRLTANYTRRHQDDSSYRDYTQAAQEAYLRADWAFRPGWNWNLQANHIGERPRKASDTRPALAAYTLVDTTLRHAAAKDWEFAVSIRNLLDADAREYTSPAILNDLPLPGRNLYAEIRYKF